jgi:hypothetical protein
MEMVDKYYVLKNILRQLGTAFGIANKTLLTKVF